MERGVVHHVSNSVFIYLFIFIKLFIYLFFFFLATLGLRCCAQAFSSAVCGLLIVVAPLVVEYGL